MLKNEKNQLVLIALENAGKCPNRDANVITVCGDFRAEVRALHVQTGIPMKVIVAQLLEYAMENVVLVESKSE